MISPEKLFILMKFMSLVESHRAQSWDQRCSAYILMTVQHT